MRPGAWMGVILAAGLPAFPAYAGGDTYMNTGADSCANSVSVPIEVGPSGSPIVTTILGDNTPATQGGCFPLIGIPTWWERLAVQADARLVLEFCGSSPVHDPMMTRLFRQCNAGSCSQEVFATSSGQGGPYCQDTNRWAIFGPLPAGTYYYPLRTDGPRGPYQLHVHADELPIPEEPDIITGQIDTLLQLGREGDVGEGAVGLGVDSTMCNLGGAIDIDALPEVKHPLIMANLFRLHTESGSSRMEHIGQSWLKHTFGSSNLNECGLGCDCSATNCNVDSLGWRCSDTYSALQFLPCDLGPRSAVHPFTVAMAEGPNSGFDGTCNNFPSNNHLGHNHPYTGFSYSGIRHRLQVLDTDLIPAMNPGAQYYAEVQYITPDEFLAGNGNQHNNASHQEFSVGGPDQDGLFTFAPLTGTIRESPAIDAWPGATQQIIEPYPLQDGRAILAYRVTDLGASIWHYEYLIYNMNMDAAVASLRIPVASHSDISNVGFHAPLAHAPELHADNYSTDPWTMTREGGDFTFATDDFATDPLANAIRWGTGYNFRFDADTPPTMTNATVGLFKTGGAAVVPILAPSAPVPAMSSWGLLCLAFVLLIAGATVLGHAGGGRPRRVEG